MPPPRESNNDAPAGFDAPASAPVASDAAADDPMKGLVDSMNRDRAKKP